MSNLSYTVGFISTLKPNDKSETISGDRTDRAARMENRDGNGIRSKGTGADQTPAAPTPLQTLLTVLQHLSDLPGRGGPQIVSSRSRGQADTKVQRW